MKIEREGTLVMFTPENDRESDELDHLWKLVVDCVKDNKKLVPVGEYIKGIKETATFNVE